MGPAVVSLSLIPSLHPQPLQMSSGPEVPALWLAWPLGSWFWSVPWRPIQPLRLSGTEMASCCRWVRAEDPGTPPPVPLRPQTLSRPGPGAEGPRGASAVRARAPGLSAPLLLSPPVLDGDTEARLRAAHGAAYV